MLGGKITLFAVLGGLIVGMVIGGVFGATVLRPDINKAVVKQLEKDNQKLTQIKKEVEIKYVYRDKIKTVIKNVASDECFDKPIPIDAANQLLNALQYERP